MTLTAETVDVNIPRINQATVALLTAVAFVASWEWLVAATFALLAVTRLGGPRYAPVTRLYLWFRRRFRPGLAGEVEAAAPPRFAQTLGVGFLGAATLSFAVGATTLGWVFTLPVTALAALAATTRICVGCLIYTRVVAR